jgi:hypothetical protein
MSPVPLGELQALSGAVNARAHLRDVHLVTCVVIGGEEAAYDLDMFVKTDVGTSARQVDEVLEVLSHYTVRAFRWTPNEHAEEPSMDEDDEDLVFAPGVEPDSDSDPAWEIKASFLATHWLRPLEDGESGPAELTDRQLRAYSLMTGAMAIHPYAREFVQNMSTRLGYPAFTLPLMRRPADTAGPADFPVEVDLPDDLFL